MSCCNFRTLKSTNIEVVENTLQVTIDETTLANCNYCLIIEQDIPCNALGFPVIVLNGEDTIPLWTCGCAKSVFGTQLVNSGLQRKCGCDCDIFVPVEYVNCEIESNPPHFTVTRRLSSIKPCCN